MFDAHEDLPCPENIQDVGQPVGPPQAPGHTHPHAESTHLRNHQLEGSLLAVIGPLVFSITILMGIHHAAATACAAQPGMASVSLSDQK